MSSVLDFICSWQPCLLVIRESQTAHQMSELQIPFPLGSLFSPEKKLHFPFLSIRFLTTVWQAIQCGSVDMGLGRLYANLPLVPSFQPISSPLPRQLSVWISMDCVAPSLSCPPHKHSELRFPLSCCIGYPPASHFPKFYEIYHLLTATFLFFGHLWFNCMSFNSPSTCCVLV